MQQCSNYRKYTAEYPPRCNRGRGCETCNMKWQGKQRARFRQIRRLAGEVIKAHDKTLRKLDS